GSDLPWRHSRTRLDSPDEQFRASLRDAGGASWQQEAMGEAADSLVASELATIYQLVKAKSERLMEREHQLHCSECFVAEAAALLVGAAKARLRAEVDELLRRSQQELKKEANAQRKRLEDLFQKAQEEFRKAVTWRKEARVMKGAAVQEKESHEKLQKKVQELVRREKALRQQHAEEKERWVEEKEKLERQAALQERPFPEAHRVLDDSQQHLLRSSSSLALRRPQGRDSEGLPLDLQVRMDDLDAGSESWSVPFMEALDREDLCYPPSAPVPSAPKLGSEELQAHAAWWGVDTVAFGHRGLWGCAALLAAEPVKSQELQSWFLRRWAWQALLTDASSLWQSASVLAKEKRPLENLPLQPFDLRQWLPDQRDRPLVKLRRRLRPLLAQSEDVAGDGHLLWLWPASAQRALAGALWRDVRQQLLTSEKALRLGRADPSTLAQAARSLLCVAALSLDASPDDAQAALRSLARLCAGHAEELPSRMADALPVLLWLADATGATGRCPPATGGTTELTAKALQELGFASLEPGHPAAVHVIAAALLRAPAEAVTKPTLSLLTLMAELLHKAAESAVAKLEKSTAQMEDALERRSLRAWRGPLRRWLEHLQEAGICSRTSPLGAWVNGSIGVLDELPLY
ncbi:unnamed protein product, partial [Effrenium voratum]